MPEATFTLTRRYLVGSIKAAMSAVPTRSPKAILKNLRLHCNGAVTVSGFDSEAAVVTEDSSGEREGEAGILVSPKLLLDTLKLSKSLDVTVRVAHNEWVEVDGTRLPADKAIEEYPPPAWLTEADTSFAVNGHTLATALRSVIHSLDETATRYALHGVCFRFLKSEGKLELAATDSKRLAIAPVGLTGGGFGEKRDSLLIPMATAKRLISQADVDCDVLVAANDRMVEFQIVSSDYRMAFQTIQMEGRFPRYWDGVVPTTGNAIAVNRAELTAACLRVKPLWGKDDSARCRFTVGDKAVGYHSMSDSGRAEGEFKCQNTMAATVTTWLDAVYLLEWLQSIPKDIDTVSWQFTDGDSPMLFSANTVESTLQYVLMPIESPKPPAPAKAPTPFQVHQMYKKGRRDYPADILLFKMGDFYEAFYDDAEALGPMLGLSITSRLKGDEKLPMVGFPAHTLKAYLGKIVASGRTHHVID